MFLKTPLVKTINLYRGETTVVKFNENIEFTITPVTDPPTYIPGRTNYLIENIKGDFEILKLVDGSNGITIPYNNETKIFCNNYIPLIPTLDIYLMANMDFQTVISVTHRLQIPQARFQYLEPNQMFIDNIVLTNSTKNTSFKYYGKRIDKENIQIHIENPASLGVKLNGQKGDFHHTTKLQDIDLMLSFIFEISESDEQNSEECESRPSSVTLNDAIEENAEKVLQENPASKNLTIPEKEDALSEYSEKRQSHPSPVSLNDAIKENAENVETVLQNNPPKNIFSTLTVPGKENTPAMTNLSTENVINILQNMATQNQTTLQKHSLHSFFKTEECPSKSKWNKMSNDMILQTSDGKVFPFHHSYLSKHSTKFAKLFQDSKTLPLIVNINLSSYFFQAALDFLNEKSDPISIAIVQNEKDLFFFADEWNIPALMKAGLSKMKEFIQPSNVCKIIQMAFKNEWEETKKLCKNCISEEIAKIHSEDIENLSPEIVYYIFEY